MDGFVFLITPYICFVLDYVFLAQVLPRKVSYRKILVLLLPELLVQVLKMQFGSMTLGVQMFNIAFAIYGIIILPLICFEGPRWKKILLSTFFYLILFLVDVLVYMVFYPVLGTFGEDMNAQQTFIYAGATWAIYSLICVLIIWISRMLRFRKFQPFYLLYLVFPVSQSIMLYSSIYGTQKYVWLLGIVLSLGAQIALLIYTIAQEDKSALEERLREARHVMALEHTHYREVEQRQEELAHIRHDFNNQLAAIGQLIRNGEDEEAVQLVQSLREAIGYTNQSVYSDITVVNAILIEKATVCAEKSIVLDIELEMPASIKLEPMLLCSVFSNLMDHAISRAEDSVEGNRHIKLSAYIDGNYLSVRTISASISANKRDNGQTYEGRILADIAEKHGGELRYETGDVHESAMISIRL